MFKKSFATALVAAAMILSLGGVAHAAPGNCVGSTGERTSNTARDGSGYGVSDSDAPQKRMLQRCLLNPGQSEKSYLRD